MSDPSPAPPAAVKLRILGPCPQWSDDARVGRLERPDGTVADVYLTPADDYLPGAAPSAGRGAAPATAASLDPLREAARRVAALRHDGLLHLKQVARVDGVDLVVFSGPDRLRSTAHLLQAGPAPLRAALEVVAAAAGPAGAALEHGLDPAPALAPDRVLLAPDGALRIAGVGPKAGTAADASFALGALLLCMLLGDAGAAPRSPAQARRALIRLLSEGGTRPPDAVVDLLRAALSPELEARPAPAGLGAALGALARGQPGRGRTRWLLDLGAGGSMPEPPRPLGLVTGPLPDMLGDAPTTDMVDGAVGLGPDSDTDIAADASDGVLSRDDAATADAVADAAAVEGGAVDDPAAHDAAADDPAAEDAATDDVGGIDEVVPAGLREARRPLRRRDPTAPLGRPLERPVDGGTQPVIEDVVVEDTEEVAREQWPPAPVEKTVASDGTPPEPQPGRPRPPIGGAAVPAIPDHRDTSPGLGHEGPALVIGAVARGEGGPGEGGIGGGVLDDGGLDDDLLPRRTTGAGWAAAIVVLLLGGGAAGAWWWLGQARLPADAGMTGTTAMEVEAAPAAVPAMPGPDGLPAGELGEEEQAAQEQVAEEQVSEEQVAPEQVAAEQVAEEQVVAVPVRRAEPVDGAGAGSSKPPVAARRGSPEPDLRVRIAPPSGGASRDPVLDDDRAGDAWVPPQRDEPTRAVIEVSVGADGRPADPGDAAASGDASIASSASVPAPLPPAAEPRPWTLTFRAGPGADPRIEVTCHGGRTGSGSVVTIPDAVPGPCRVEGHADTTGRLVAHVSVSGSAVYTCFADGARACR